MNGMVMFVAVWIHPTHPPQMSPWRHQHPAATNADQVTTRKFTYEMTRRGKFEKYR